MSYNSLLKNNNIGKREDRDNYLYEDYIKNRQTPKPNKNDEKRPKDNENKKQKGNKEENNNLKKEIQNKKNPNNNIITPKNDLSNNKDSYETPKDRENNDKQQNDDVNSIINDYYYQEILKKKTKKIFTDSRYVSFENRLGENACYVNVIIHFLYLFPCVNDYLIRKYQEKKRKDAKINEKKEEDKKKKDIENNKKELGGEGENDDKKSNEIKLPKDPTKNANNKTKKSKGEIKNEENSKFLFDLGKVLNDYQNSILSTKDEVGHITQLKTNQLRESLSISSDNLFKLNNISDPVEFLIYILDLINKENVDEIHDYFHLNLIEERRCTSFCSYKNQKKYDKDNFIYQIYVEEIFNYIKNNNLDFKEFKENLFMLSYYSLQNEVIKCEKCKNSILNKILICNNRQGKPKFLLINCIWKNVKPELPDVVKFLYLISLVDEIDNLFICPNKEGKDNYYLIGIIFYSFSLCHYINMSFNVSSNVFTLHNDEGIIEFKNINDLYRYLTIQQFKTNNQAYFYPVLLIYGKDEIYDEPIIPTIKQTNKFNYEILLKEWNEEIKKNIKIEIPLTKEQKEENYRALVLAQIKHDREQEINNLLKNKNKERHLDFNDNKVIDNRIKLINEQNKLKNNFLKGNKKAGSVDYKKNNINLLKPNQYSQLNNNNRRVNEILTGNHLDYLKDNYDYSRARQGNNYDFFSKMNDYQRFGYS